MPSLRKHMGVLKIAMLSAALAALGACAFEEGPGDGAPAPARKPEPGAQSPAEPSKAPSGAALSAKTSSAAFRDWLLACNGEGFRKTAPQDAAWSADAAAFIGKACLAFSLESEAPTWETLESQGSNLIAKGCDDPFVRLWLGQALLKTGKPSLAMPQFRRATAKLQKWDYPKLALAFASDGLAEASSELASQDSLEKAAMNIAATAMAESASDLGDFAPPSQFAVYGRMISLWSASRNPKFWKMASEVAASDSKYPQWLKRAFEARAFLEASKADPDKESSRELLLKGIDAASKLWKESPERPEAPAIVLMALALDPSAPSGAPPSEWLRRAVDAQCDYAPAYICYIDVLASSKDASEDALMKFGSSCLEKGGFDSCVPRFYIGCLLKSACLRPFFNWRQPFLRPGVAAGIERLYVALLQETPPSAKARRDTLAMERALLLSWCGDYEGARDLLSKIPSEPSLMAAAFSDFSVPWKPQSIQDFEAEIRAFTSSNKELFLQWDQSLRGADLSLKEQASKLLSLYAGDKPIKKFVRAWTAWHLTGLPAAQIPDGEESDPLIYAIKAKRPDVMKFLLDSGLEIKRKGKDKDEGGALLMLAFSNDASEETLKLLIARGADVDFKAPSGETPLLIALSRKMPAVSEFLVEMGSDPNAHYSDTGVSALDLACSLGFPSVAKALLKRGARPEAQDKAGRNALHYAVQGGSEEIAAMLLERGAALPGMRSREGETPLELAERLGASPGMIVLLKSPARQERRK